jgi:AraC-like DNA-binding protein
LKDEKTTYQKLLAAVRKEIALSYLKEKEATICDIAFLLGFSEQSAFNHAFKRWTGFTPREYLKRSNPGL